MVIFKNKISLELKNLFQVRKRLINENVSHKKKVPLSASEILVSNISCVNLSLSGAEIDLLQIQFIIISYHWEFLLDYKLAQDSKKSR